MYLYFQIKKDEYARRITVILMNNHHLQEHPMILYLQKNWFIG